jgi:hypothetical protein
MIVGDYETWKISSYDHRDIPPEKKDFSKPGSIGQTFVTYLAKNSATVINTIAGHGI